MLKLLSSILISLPIVSACGSEHGEEIITGSITGFSMFGGGTLGASHFGLAGGIISILIIISLILSIALLTKKLNQKSWKEVFRFLNEAYVNRMEIKINKKTALWSVIGLLLVVVVYATFFRDVTTTTTLGVSAGQAASAYSDMVGGCWPN